jgi:hypothetical protein
LNVTRVNRDKSRNRTRQHLRMCAACVRLAAEREESES